MVKEFDREQGGKIFLAIDLYNEMHNGKNSVNEQLEFSYRIISFLLRRRYQVIVGWWSVSGQNFRSRPVSHEDLIPQVFADLLGDQVYEDAALLSHVLPKDVPYLIPDNTNL